MSEARIALGKKGEELAAAHLRGLGYRILERNCRLSTGELDIVARDGPVLVFVEVKTRTGVGFGGPLEAVTVRKQRQLVKAALEYLGRKGLRNRPVRFDVVGVLMTGGTGPTAGPVRIELVRNAFDQGLG
ncbi:MAG: YraN family protein [Desulfobacterales bacterium]|nr:YraN family protein [Desulfobacterales bacterium]